jgi:hypothetical protein
MTVEYPFSNLEKVPSIDFLKLAVEYSDMSDKELLECHYDSMWDSTLLAVFQNALGPADQGILGGCVAACLGKKQIRITETEVMQAIFHSASSPEQGMRLLETVREFGDLTVALGAYNYEMARTIVQGAYDGGSMALADYECCMGAIPEQNWIDT